MARGPPSNPVVCVSHSATHLSPAGARRFSMGRKRKDRKVARLNVLFPEWERDLYDQPEKKQADDQFIPAEITPGRPPSPPKGK